MGRTTAQQALKALGIKRCQTDGRGNWICGSKVKRFGK